MFYQLAIVCCAATVVLAVPTDVVPLEKQQPTVIPIISQSEELEPNGTYKFSYETGNGIKREEISYDKIVPKAEGRSSGSNEGGESSESDEIHVQQGSYSYTAPDGTLITLRYIADENGFQAFGDHLPRAPAPVQVSSSSLEKTGRALKNANSVESAPTPASDSKPESAPEPAKPAPEPAQPAPKPSQPAPEVQTESNVPASGAESSIAEVPAAPEEPASVTQAAEKSGTTLAPETSTLEAEQSATAVSDQSTSVAAEQSTTISAEQSSTKAASEASTVASDQPTPAVTEGESAPAAAEQPASSTVADQASAQAESNSAEGSQQPVATTSSQPSVEDAASTVSA